MKTTEFKQIIDAVKLQDENCKNVLSTYYKCGMDISKMSVASLNSTIMECRKIHSDMDKIVRDDLYHIIGMTNMNAVQTSQFVKSIKNFTKYRNHIKFFASMNTVYVHDVGKEHNYTLSSGIKITSKIN